MREPNVLRILVYLPPLEGHVFPVVPTMMELSARGHEVTAHASGRIARLLRPVTAVIPGMHPPRPGPTAGSWMLQCRQEAALLGAGIRAVRPDVVIVHEGCPGAKAVAASSGMPWVSVYVSPMPERLRPNISHPHAALYYTAAPLEARRDLPDFVHLVGPALWEPPAVEQSPQFSEGESLILVTRSSYVDPEHDILRDVVRAFPHPEIRIVVTGEGTDPVSGSIPAHISVAAYAPHMPLLRRAQCVITHAGPGIAQKALWVGVPMCVVPGGRDQSRIADQLVATGAAVEVPETAPRSEALRASALECLELRSRAEAIATDWQSRRPGEQSAADVVEQCVLGGTA